MPSSNTFSIVQFILSGYPDKTPSPHKKMHTEIHISDELYKLCRSEDSASNAYANKPNEEIGQVAAQVYSSHHSADIETKPPQTRVPATQEDLQRAYSCGRFGNTKPSELFLRAYHDVLLSVQHDPLSGVVSPSLLGSTGVIPVTVVGPLIDTVRHMSNLIARARKEVFFATCSWKVSGPTTMIGDAIRELSRRAGKRGEKVVVKVLFDQAALKQFADPHQLIPAKDWVGDKVKLPAQEEIPNVDLQVLSFHKFALGTFHSKFMIVDRKVACIASNNIEDNANTEMMSHLEGSVVDCLWDTFLVSWHKAMNPPPPCLGVTASSQAVPTFSEPGFASMFNEQGQFRKPEQDTANASIPEHLPGAPQYDDSVSGEIRRMHSALTPHHQGETEPEIIARHLNYPMKNTLKPSAPSRPSNLRYFPLVPLPPHDPFPMALVNRKPFGSLNHTSLYVPQDEAFLSLIRNAKRSVFIQTPDLNAVPLLPALAEAVSRGVEVTYYVCLGYNDSGELLPGQGGTNEMAAKKIFDSLRTEEEIRRLHVHFYVAADQDHPINNKFKQRSCHIKLLIVDESVAIQGSGNQDTQSWFQSQEVNVMVDSPLVCEAWREVIERNQNTRQYGKARKDGCWYDEQGVLAEGSLGSEVGKFAWAKGIKGAVGRVTGHGGF